MLRKKNKQTNKNGWQYNYFSPELIAVPICFPVQFRKRRESVWLWQVFSFYMVLGSGSVSVLFPGFIFSSFVILVPLVSRLILPLGFLPPKFCFLKTWSPVQYTLKHISESFYLDRSFLNFFPLIPLNSDCFPTEFLPLEFCYSLKTLCKEHLNMSEKVPKYPNHPQFGLYGMSTPLLQSRSMRGHASKRNMGTF